MRPASGERAPASAVRVVGVVGGSVGVRGAAARRAPRPDPALPLTAPLPPRSAFCPSTAAPWVVWDPREALMAHVLAAHLERPGTCPHPQPHLRGRCRRDLLTGRGRRRRPGVPCRARARARSRGRATPRSPWWPAPRGGAAHGRVWGGSRPANRHAQAVRVFAWCVCPGPVHAPAQPGRARRPARGDRPDHDPVLHGRVRACSGRSRAYHRRRARLLLAHQALKRAIERASMNSTALRR